jgi:hypothetical protein
MTRVRLLKERKALWKKKREEQKRAGQLEGGVRVRGRWTASRELFLTHCHSIAKCHKSYETATGYRPWHWF